LASDATEIVEGNLYRLGDVVELDGRISWIPEDIRGYQPLNCYLIRSGDADLLVDTGVAAHREVICEQLARLLGNGASVSVYLTRAESDCVGNVGAIGERFSLDRVYAGGVLNPFDGFDNPSRANRVEVTRMRAGEVIELGSGGSLRVHQPLLRVLATYWAYHPETKTLFTSDAFSYTTLSSRSQSALAESAAPVAADELERRWLQKFAYLRGADGLQEMARDLEEVFTDNAVEAIAPTMGCVLRGSADVERHYEGLQTLLRKLDLEQQ
jgi:flavorubredoxin